MDTSKVTRFEVFQDDLPGRVYSNRPCKIQLSFQDDGRTLKVFVESVKDKPEAPSAK